MEQCECFRLATNYHKDYCAGTKECEPCSCKGDPSKCDFYEDVRRKAVGKMNTAEMWLKAQEDGKTYRISGDDACYQKDKGLFDKDSGCIWNLASWDGFEGKRGAFNTLMSENWEEYEGHFLTKAEAEAKFNIKIVG